MDKFRNFLTIPKIIFAILGIVILVELIVVVRTLISPVSAPLPEPKTSIESVGKISLSTPSQNLRIGETVPVWVAVDTGGKSISGADLILKFDPKILEATTGAVIKGKIFDEYPLVSVDAKKGLISISGIDNLNNSFNGVGQFAMINFKTKILGKTVLVVNFEKGATAASNLVEATTSENILETVDNLELEIR